MFNIKTSSWCAAFVLAVINIGDSAATPLPVQGRISLSSVNSFRLPILKYLQLSVERGVLYQNGLALTGPSAKHEI